MAEELQKKKSNIIDSLALLERYVKEYEAEPKQVGLVEAWAKRLEKLYDQYHEIAVQLEMLSTEDHPIDLKQERMKVDGKYYALSAFCLSKLSKSSTSSASKQAPSGQSLRVKLPELNLPKFSGKLEDWCVFRDSFESAIGSRTDISAVEKLQYLKGVVQGEAARILDPIKISEQGYKDAWRTLRLRFENKRQLVKCHIKTLFDTPAMKRESAEELLALVDRFEQQLSVLKSLGEPADKWSSLLVYQLSIRLDQHTHREWESYCTKLDSENIASVLGGITNKTDDSTGEETTTMPSYVKMVNFLQNYARVLIAVSPATPPPPPPPRFKSKTSKPVAFPAAASTASSSSSSASASTVGKPTPPCEKCGQDHYLYHCPDFRKLNVSQRTDLVRQKHLCMNCLRSSSHFARNCSGQRCRVCSKKHHTLLHTTVDAQSSSGGQTSGYAQQGSQVPPQSSSQTQSASLASIQQQLPSTSTANQANVQSASGTPQYALVTHSKEVCPETVFLPTALVNIRDGRGRIKVARCLLDCASQRNFISGALCERLQLPRTRLPQAIAISGIGNTSASVEYQTTVTLMSRVAPFSLNSAMLVLPSITVKLPQSTVDTCHWSIPPHIDLADPTFAVSGNIDIILGAAHFFQILRYGRINLGDQLPLLQNTEFGWVISGECLLDGHDHANPRYCRFSNPCIIEELVNRFWQLEEVQDNRGWSPSERFCEEHFAQNTTRNTEGRYVVKLPKREELLMQLKDNRYNATRRFYSLERSLEANPEKKRMYHQFIEEYVRLHHMREIGPDEADDQPQYFLPHHAVMKLDSSTTKLRTVFDASCRSKSGLSLNDLLLPGPTIQDSLVKIIMRFRFHQFVVSADIEKMFRQILVHPSDQPLQRIVWRDDPDSPLKTFQLCTVTYGTNSAPFLSTRVLQKLADDEEAQFPLAAPFLRDDFYVDNLLSGSDDESSLAVACEQLITMLASAGITLRQWSSNSQAVLDTIPPELRETSTLRDLDHDASVTTLGLRWEPSTDFLLFKPPHWAEFPVLSKRALASQISSLFDPLGFACPTIAKAKMKLQTLWRLQLDWDSPVPDGFARDWEEFKQKLSGFDLLRIPRHVLRPNYRRLELHGFSDASQLGYGACVYIRSTNGQEHHTVRLLVAKSKVAPINIKTIPRLELCAALLLSKLLGQVLENFRYDAQIVLWTDSTIVLNWISGLPLTWAPFVANRVAEIQELTSQATWNHVPSQDNPANLISRGMDLDELTESELWWHGPQWLNSNQHQWPAKYVPKANIDDERRRVVALPAIEEVHEDLIFRYSSLRHLLRIGSLLRRFCENCVRRKHNHPLVTGPLSPQEIDRTLLDLLRRVQRQHFKEEYRLLSSGRPVSHRSKLRFLNPEIVDGIIRVGGRLHNASIPVDEKHPIVLPNKHRLTEMIARREHVKTLHAGPSLLLSTLRQRYWPLGGRNLVRSIVNHCMTCARTKPRNLEQLMGNLPRVRVNQAHPFENIGVDLAGPIYVRTTLRNTRNPFIKAYIVVYVCLATKAVHLDLVTDLTSEAFIASLRRFSGRRGIPAHIYCDNGTNFVGAHRELKELRTLFDSQQHQEAVAKACADDRSHFHFIPPRSPTFGGIWEACVKSVKQLLRRILGNAHLTETELQTALIQIEAQLNSRPITPLPVSPSDEMVLTPGHFLIGRPLNAVPDPNLQNVPENRLSRWQRVQQLTQHFWNRWHREYLSTLQNRYRWTSEMDNLVVGSIVALMDERYPPQKWLLGRILSVHPGADGLVRVATVKTASGITQRAIGKLCLLPVEIDPASVSSCPTQANNTVSPVEGTPGPSSGESSVFLEHL
ncbi:uncharacterized protein LOC134286608 [Aedes albopictus]|uniref:Integrase catalytic domain-containing protein n=1 Tax=Aedes albopictus TaxID=7160 RepID=A0ABM1Y0T5_AEDAL